MRTILISTMLALTITAGGQVPWTQKSDFTGSSRYDAAGFAIGNKGYLVTGLVSDHASKEFWEWNQTTNIWTKLSDFPGTSRYCAAGFAIGNKGYLVTGLVSNYASKEFWEWDQTTNTWTKLSDFSGSSRYSAAGFAIGNIGYIITGIVSDYASKEFWEYNLSTTGINDLNNQINASVFPNPSNGRFSITLKNRQLLLNKMAIEIYNSFGQKIYYIAQFPQQTTNEIDLSNLPRGIYILKLIDRDNFYLQKIVIQ